MRPACTDAVVQWDRTWGFLPIANASMSYCGGTTLPQSQSEVELTVDFVMEPEN